jgi:hypothetical protein
MPPYLIMNGPKGASLNIALAHGAGAPMDSMFMTVFSERLAAKGFRVIRFEFPYMIKRRDTGKKTPPDRAIVLIKKWYEIIAMFGAKNIVIGGKSMGGRIASMVADEAQVRGLVCLGYPFHGIGKSINSERIDHLENLQTPSIFCQGTRDVLGNKKDVKNCNLSKAIQLHWLEDGDHSFKPRKASGLTEIGNWQNASEAIIKFLNTL